MKVDLTEPALGDQQATQLENEGLRRVLMRTQKVLQQYMKLTTTLKSQSETQKREISRLERLLVENNVEAAMTTKFT